MIRRAPSLMKGILPPFLHVIIDRRLMGKRSRRVFSSMKTELSACGNTSTLFFMCAALHSLAHVKKATTCEIPELSRLSFWRATARRCFILYTVAMAGVPQCLIVERNFDSLGSLLHPVTN